MALEESKTKAFTINSWSGRFLPGNSVMSSRDKIVPMRGKLGVPHRVVVAFVAYETSKCLEAPQPDSPIFRTRQQVVSERQKEVSRNYMRYVQM